MIVAGLLGFLGTLAVLKCLVVLLATNDSSMTGDLSGAAYKVAALVGLFGVLLAAAF